MCGDAECKGDCSGYCAGKEGAYGLAVPFGPILSARHPGAGMVLARPQPGASPELRNIKAAYYLLLPFGECCAPGSVLSSKETPDGDECCDSRCE